MNETPRSRGLVDLELEAAARLRVVLTAEPGGLGAALVTGCLQDRRDIRIGDEALPAIGIPVEEHPDPIVLVRVAADGRALRPMLPPLYPR